jgi:hypothetical protein
VEEPPVSESPLFDETKDHLLMDPDIPPRNAWFDPEAQLLPAVAPQDPAPREFTHDDGSTYQRVDPDELPSYDAIDSTHVHDPGAPD